MERAAALVAGIAVLSTAAYIFFGPDRFWRKRGMYMQLERVIISLMCTQVAVLGSLILGTRASSMQYCRYFQFILEYL